VRCHHVGVRKQFGADEARPPQNDFILGAKHLPLDITKLASRTPIANATVLERSANSRL
jgi:hypothetical protein